MEENAPRCAVFLRETLEGALAEQTFGRDVPKLDLRRERRLDPRRLGLSDRFGEFNFGLTTVSTCLLIWLETVRDCNGPVSAAAVNEIST